MDLKKTDNLWRFLVIKNNLKLEQQVSQNVSYRIQKGEQALTHTFNPKLVLNSSLSIRDKGYQENLLHKHHQTAKKRFGINQKVISPVSSNVFFPRELLKLSLKYDLEILQDRLGHYNVTISPFYPKNIYDILNTVNLISRTLWVKNFFAEGIRN
ncbi:hypothetical protein MM236_11200 [Belliella sp. DSM 107340]|uniref:Uncharacterized protein n=1 Tax=Belliella calami TaxID=2923436 RepID=A0ABS9UPK2_9BACT|nr:hypothetical protein [Belliella calami]MCH7398562.1 hypothetical protein [Belliella calami]